MRATNRLATTVTAIGLATVALGATNVVADPIGTPSPPIMGVTTADTQPLMKAIGQDLFVNGRHPIGEWDDPGAAGLPGCTVTRNPVSSAIARALLIASLQAGDGCVKWATVTSLDLSP